MLTRTKAICIDQTQKSQPLTVMQCVLYKTGGMMVGFRSSGDELEPDAGAEGLVSVCIK